MWFHVTGNVFHRTVLITYKTHEDIRTQVDGQSRIVSALETKNNL